jgi:hypothetical protein
VLINVINQKEQISGIIAQLSSQDIVISVLKEDSIPKNYAKTNFHLRLSANFGTHRKMEK